MANYTKADLIEELRLQDVFADVTKKRVTELVDDIFEIIASKIEAGENVTIPGFGKFEKFTRANGVNTPKFRPFTALKERVSA